MNARIHIHVQAKETVKLLQRDGIDQHLFRPPYPYVTAVSPCILCGQHSQSLIHSLALPAQVVRILKGSRAPRVTL